MNILRPWQVPQLRRLAKTLLNPETCSADDGHVRTLSPGSAFQPSLRALAQRFRFESKKDAAAEQAPIERNFKAWLPTIPNPAYLMQVDSERQWIVAEPKGATLRSKQASPSPLA